MEEPGRLVHVVVKSRTRLSDFTHSSDYKPCAQRQSWHGSSSVRMFYKEKTELTHIENKHIVTKRERWGEIN